MKTLVLVDFFNVLYRIHFGFRPKLSHKNLSTRIPYGFLSQWCSWQDEFSPQRCILVVDGEQARGFQQQRLERLIPNNQISYKGHRAKTPEEIVDAIPQIQSLANTLGTPSVQVKEWEADDTIALLTRDAISNQMYDKVAIISNDKDLEQLKSPQVEIKSNRTSALPIPPQQVPDYLALVGDAADGIPGVKGIGPKTAANLLNANGGNVHSLLNAIREFQEQSCFSENPVGKELKPANEESKRALGIRRQLVDQLLADAEQLQACVQIVKLGNIDALGPQTDNLPWPTHWPPSDQSEIQKLLDDMNIGKRMCTRVQRHVKRMNGLK